MEELTLHHGNFAIPEKQVKEYTQRTGCSNQVADQALWSQLFLDEMKECPGWNTANRQEWNLFLLEWIFHNAAAMWHKEHQKCSHGLPLEPTETALEHPSLQTLVESWDSDLLWVTEQIHKGKYVVTPSMFTCAQQEDLMKELQKELSRCLTQAGLQAERGPDELPSRSWRCSWGPEEEDQALKVKQQDRWSWSGRTRTHSRGRSGLRWQQSPSSSHPSQHWLLSPSPTWSHPADEQLHYPMENLKITTKV